MTSWRLSQRTGSELFTTELAAALNKRGHEVVVYTTRVGRLAEEAAEQGIPVIRRFEACPFVPDIIHGQRKFELLGALHSFPSVPAVYVIHGAEGNLSEPLPIPRVLRHVGVDDRCKSRIQQFGRVPAQEIRVILNAVDLDRFRPRAKLPERPVRALLFSNYASRFTHLRPVQRACARLNIALDVVGAGVGRICDRPETILPNYDLVFAKARCALEALAVGNAVVLCDTSGLGQMVTSKTVAHARRLNFGAGLLTRPLDSDEIVREVLRYDAQDAFRVSQVMRECAGLEPATSAWIDLYREALQDANTLSPGEEDRAELTRALAQAKLANSATTVREYLWRGAQYSALGRLAFQAVFEPVDAVRRVLRSRTQAMDDATHGTTHCGD